MVQWGKICGRVERLMKRMLSFGLLIVCLLMFTDLWIRAQDRVWAPYQGVRIFRKNGKFGLMQGDGSVICHAICDKIDMQTSRASSPDKAFWYYRLERDGLQGIYDPATQFLLMPEWENTVGYGLYDGYAPYDEYLTLTKEGKSYLWSLTKNEAVLDIDTPSLGFPYGGLMQAEIDGKYCFIDMQGEIAFEGSWDNVGSFHLGPFTYVVQERQFGVIDNQGNLVVPCEWDTLYFNEGMLKTGIISVCRDERWGIVDIEGKVLIEPRLASMPDWVAVGEGGFFVHSEENAALEETLDSRRVLTNIQGQTIGGENAVWDDWRVVSDRLITVEKNGRWQIVDLMGSPVDDSLWDGVEGYYFYRNALSKEQIRVRRGRKYGYLTADGKVALEPYWLDGGVFSEGVACVRDPQSRLYGYIDQSGEYVLQPKWNDGTDFIQGGAFVKEGELWGRINTTGEYLIKPQWDDVRIDTEDDERTDMFVVSKGYKKGVVSKDGTVLAQPEWNDIKMFNGTRYWLVKKRGEWGVFDPKTQTVVSGERLAEDQFSDNYMRIYGAEVIEERPSDVLVNTGISSSVYYNGYGEVVWEEAVHYPGR